MRDCLQNACYGLRYFSPYVTPGSWGVAKDARLILPCYLSVHQGISQTDSLKVNPISSV